MRLYICILFFVFAQSAHARRWDNSVYFNHISINQGLSNLHVFDIAQDSDGFLWFGTENGLNRYDGINMKIYKNNPRKKNTLPSSSISCLFSDSKGRLWVGTIQGLALYLKEKDEFNNFSNISVLSQNNIRCFYEDKQGLLWIGTQLGLIRFNPDTEETKVYNKLNSKLSHNIVRAIHEDKNGRMWVGTFDGLNCLDKEKSVFSTFYPVKTYPGDPPNNLILCIMPASERKIWVGTETGLCQFDTEDYSYRILRKENTSGMLNNVIKNIQPVNENTLWIGTDGGLLIYDGKEFDTIVNDPFIDNSLPNNIIWKIYKDKTGIVWLATNNGIAKCNPQNELFRINRLASPDAPQFHGMTVNGMLFEKDNTCWITSQYGLAHFNLNTKELRWFKSEGQSVAFNNVYRSLFKDKYENLWIGTSDEMICFNTNTSRFINLNHYNIPKTKYNNWIASVNDTTFWMGDLFGNFIRYHLIYKSGRLKEIETDAFYVDGGIWGLEVDDHGHVWLAAKNGLIEFTPQDNMFREYYAGAYMQSENVVRTVHRDDKGQIWCTTEEGLFLYNEEKRILDKIEILSGTFIFKIQSDKEGSLWISSDRGILKYDPKENDLIHYDLSFYKNFLQLINLSSERDFDGNIYFAGTDGFIVFDPNDIHTRIADYPLFITDIKLFSRSLQIDGKFLSKQVYLTDRVVLPYNKNVLSFSFSMLDYSSPDFVRYSYKLENFDKNWMWTEEGVNQAIYSNLPPGKYVFRVKATNADGVVNNRESAIKVEILQPLWLRWWAVALYIFILICIVYMIRKQQLSKMKLENALQKERLDKEKNEEVNQIKLRFFTNISHEFKTPLSLILGPVNSMLTENFDEKNKKRLHLMRQNAERLLRLINQIIDFRKIEDHKMTISLEQGELVGFVRNIFNSFTELAEKKQVHTHFEVSESTIYTSFDFDKMDKILFNLLSNAIKFTQEGGKITLRLSVLNDEIEMEVSDTGIGIPEKDIMYIFDRFYQVQEHVALASNSSGIGLTLVKEFVELHGGDLQVRSQEGKGSVFTVILPYKKGEKVTDGREELPEIELEEEIESDISEEKSGLPLVLLVEDNDEMREYILNELSKTFRFVVASNGEEGVSQAIKQMPDLIVSDVMMPVMDGFQLCKQLKNEFFTSHIPIILLTAKSSEESVIEGYVSGADAYIGKPFSIRILESRILNLIQQRENIKESLRRSIIMTPQAYDKQSPDELFLAKAVALVEKRISEPDLNIQKLCDELGVTHMQFYRKLKALVGQNINEFVRSIRLKRAAQLLSISGFNVTEVMYDVGFNSRSYFSKCFKDLYGVFPKEYARQHASDKIQEL